MFGGLYFAQAVFAGALAVAPAAPVAPPCGAGTFGGLYFAQHTTCEETTVGGVRSMLAPWMGGASAPSTVVSGVRSLLAPWMGGASSPVTVTQAGYRSLLAFWAGGACAAATTTITTATPLGKPNAFRASLHDFRDDGRLEKELLEDEEELIYLIAIATSIISS